MAAFMLLLAMIFCINGHFTWFAGPKNWWLGASPLHEKWWAQQQVWWLSGEWWINSCPAFLIGMLFAQFETQIRDWFRKCYWGKLVLVLVLTIAAMILSGFGQMRFGWWSEFNGNGPDISNKIITYFCVIPYSMLFPVLLFTIMLKYKVSNPVSRFFGKYSLETYMMNLILITAFRFLLYKWTRQYGNMPVYKTGNYNLAIYFVAVFAGTILLGLLYKFLCGLIQKRIK